MPFGSLLPALAKAWPRLRARFLSIACGLFLGFLAGSWFGALVGALLGSLCGILLRQFRSDGEIVRYLEDPGPGPEGEPSPGAVAFCAIAALVSRLSAQNVGQWGSRQAESSPLAQTAAELAAEVLRIPASSIPVLEHWASLALSRSETLNLDLLAESLAARRRREGDAPLLLARLRALARSPSAKHLVERLSETLDPQGLSGGDCGKGVPEEGSLDAADDPWAVLGLERGASPRAVKAAFRRLAACYHPDVRAGGADAKADAADFIRIERAYREISSRQRQVQAGGIRQAEKKPARRGRS